LNFLNVHTAGLLTTVQDCGRPGAAHWGVSASGAADGLALRAGNLLLGNRENTPALEMTLVGGGFSFEAETQIVLAGADFEAQLAGADFEAQLAGADVKPWRVITLAPGQELRIGAARTGARCYLCVRGGLDVPRILESASTHVVTHLGGLEGRALRAGDRIAVGAAPARAPWNAPIPAWLHQAYSPRAIRVTRGPQWDWFGPEAEAAFVSAPYMVREQSNRMGIRLTGPVLTQLTDESLLTEGVSLGAIQIDGTGQPIVLFVEHQTTGGYPKLANVCSVDFHRLGQLRPRDRVQFEFVSFAIARGAFLEQEALLKRLQNGSGT